MMFRMRRKLKVLIVGAMFLICVSGVGVSFAQDDGGLIVEGKSFEKVLIGKTSMDEVAAIYGENYELMNHKGYSYEMIYVSLGLSFFSCQSDPNKEIFDVEIRTPRKAKTGSGIVLGESTLADVFRIYEGVGKRNFSDSDQKGVLFFVEPDHDSNAAYEPEIYEAASAELQAHNQRVIQRIKLIEPGGLRQCSSKFPQK